jgi:hypothetical protein
MKLVDMISILSEVDDSVMEVLENYEQISDAVPFSLESYKTVQAREGAVSDHIESCLGVRNRHLYSSCRTVIRCGNYIIKIAFTEDDLVQNESELELNNIVYPVTFDHGLGVNFPKLFWVSENKTILIYEFVPSEKEVKYKWSRSIISAVLSKLELLFGLRDLRGPNYKIRGNTLWVLDMGVSIEHGLN